MKILIATVALLAAPAMAHAQDAATQQYIDGAFAAMDGNKDGKVDRAEFATFMKARLARQAQAFDEAFASLDTNGNGSIDKAEAAKNATLLENFATIDADGNGALSKDELRSAMVAAQAAEAGAQ